MLAHIDCLACACLIRAKEPSCPFCGASQTHEPAPRSRLMLGLTLGLSLGTVGCGDAESDSGGDTIHESNTFEADAVTYAGADPWTDGWGEDTVQGTTGTSTTTGTTYNDSWDADAVTYAGPDETTAVGDSFEPTTTGETTTTGESSTSETDGCEPITLDPSAIGDDCEVDADCPDGYTCQPFAGFVLQLQCQVLCEQTCECPPGLTCNETVDKSGVPWMQCG